jgi:hypothetical protein
VAAKEWYELRNLLSSILGKATFIYYFGSKSLLRKRNPKEKHQLIVPRKGRQNKLECLLDAKSYICVFGQVTEGCSTQQGRGNGLASFKKKSFFYDFSFFFQYFFFLRH